VDFSALGRNRRLPRLRRPGRYQRQPLHGELAAPEYRWIRTPAIGISLHALAGGGYGVFNYHVPSGVTNKQIGIYSNGTTFDLIGGANIDFNTSSQFAVRISPNVFTSDFNGDLRPSFTITAGVVWRYGRF